MGEIRTQASVDADSRADTVSDEPRDLADYDVVTDDSATLGYGDEAVQRGQRVLRVAEREGSPKKPKSSKKPPRKKDNKWKTEDAPGGPHAATSTIYFFWYWPEIYKGFTMEDFLHELHGSTDPAKYAETSPFLHQGINIEVRQHSANAWNDLGDALHESGAIVIFWGHSFGFTKTTPATRLRPVYDSDDESFDISFVQLKQLLGTMNAKAFVIAACATSKSVGKWKRDTVIIPTYSGTDLLTNSINWYNALRIFLQRFVAGDTLAKCVEAANKTWPSEGKDSDDRFVVRSGNSKMTLKT